VATRVGLPTRRTFPVARATPQRWRHQYPPPPPFSSFPPTLLPPPSAALLLLYSHFSLLALRGTLWLSTSASHAPFARLSYRERDREREREREVGEGSIRRAKEKQKPHFSCKLPYFCRTVPRDSPPYFCIHSFIQSVRSSSCRRARTSAWSRTMLVTNVTKLPSRFSAKRYHYLHLHLVRSIPRHKSSRFPIRIPCRHFIILRILIQSRSTLLRFSLLFPRVIRSVPP